MTGKKDCCKELIDLVKDVPVEKLGVIGCRKCGTMFEHRDDKWKMFEFTFTTKTDKDVVINPS